MPFEVPKIATLDEGDGGWAGLCECGYKTSGWPQKKIATDRISQHRAEHESWIENQDDPKKWVYMDSLEDFRAKHGLVQSQENGNLAVFPEGATEVKTPTRSAKTEAETEAEEVEE